VQSENRTLTASARSPLPAKNHAAPARPASPSATDITTMGTCAPAREGWMPGSGSIGSRKCGIDRKPPIAESTARIASTPVIDSGDSWTWAAACGSRREAPKNTSHSRRNM